MNSNLTVRKATPEDRQSVFPLAKTMATFFEVEEKSFNQSFHEIHGNDSSICLVAEIDNKLVGYLIGFDHRAFYANGRVSWVEEVFVTDELLKGQIVF